MVKIKKVIYSEKEILEAIEIAAERINNEFNDFDLTLICLLKGSANFAYEISKRIKIDHKIGYIMAKSYYGETSPKKEPTILSDIDFSIENNNVIIIEDIIDTGRTLKKIYNHLQEKNPKSISIFTLLDKKVNRETKIKIDHSCFKDVPNKFLIGFGLDYKEKFRNWKDIVEVDINES